MAKRSTAYVSTVFEGQDHVSKVLRGVGMRAKATFGGIAKSALSLKGLLAGAGIFAGVKAAVTSLTEEARTLAKLRQQALAIKGTTPQELSEARAAFGQMSSSADAADKSLGQLSMRLEQMRAGTGELYALFNQQIKIATPDERQRLVAFQQELASTTSTLGALELIMERLGDDPDQALPLLYSAVGRRNAAEVVKVLKEGGKAAWDVQRAAARARLGDQINQAADAGQRFADAIDRVKEAWTSVKWRAVEQLTAVVLPKLDQLTTYLAEHPERIGKALELLGTSLASALEWLAKNLEPLIQKLGRLGERLGMGPSGTSASWGEAIERQKTTRERVADIWTGANEKNPNIIQQAIGQIGSSWGESGAAVGAVAGVATDFMSWWNSDGREAFRAQRSQQVEVDVRLGVAPGITASAEVRGAYMRSVNLSPRRVGRPQ